MTWIDTQHCIVTLYHHTGEGARATFNEIGTAEAAVPT
jgi:hypothetical protein